jgi:hypothetical protein
MHDNQDRLVRQNVDTALQRLVENDHDLLELNANERTITGRLGIYLQELFPEWNVDCEHNRILECVNEVVIDLVVTLIVPDIIVHGRNTGDNLVSFEVKKHHILGERAAPFSVS